MHSRERILLITILLILALLPQISNSVIAYKMEKENYVKHMDSLHNITLMQENQTGVRVADAKDLYIPFHYQETSYSCGPAALEMLLSYYNFYVSEKYLREVANTVPGVGSYASDIVRAARFSVLSTAIQDSDLHGYPGRKIGFLALGRIDLTMSDLKNLIDQGYPVLVLMSYDYGAYGHFRVVKGYNDEISAFIVNDPWYDPAPYGGPNTLINYTVFQDLWRYSTYWGMIIVPFNFKVGINPITENSYAIDFDLNYTVPKPFEPVALDLYNVTLNISTTEGLITNKESVKLNTILSLHGTVHTEFVVNTTRNKFYPSDKITLEFYGTIEDSSMSYNSYKDYVGTIISVSLGDNKEPQIDVKTDNRVINKTLKLDIHTYDNQGTKDLYVFWNEIDSRNPINRKGFVSGNVSTQISISRGEIYLELTVLARDIGDNQKFFTEVLYIKDLPPLIQAPATYIQNQEGNLTIPINVSDDFGLENIVVKFDSSTIGTYDKPINYVNVSTVEGTHLLLIKAVDNKKQETVKTVDVIYDYEKPSLNIKKTVDSWIIGSIKLHIEATDNLEIAKIEIQMDNKLVANKTIESKSATLSLQKMLIGSHMFEVNVTDLAGNQTTQIFKIFAIPLVITIVSVAIVATLFFAYRKHLK